jgi:hypothetical protein
LIARGGKADPAFRGKFAGLSAVPTKEKDFAELPDAADWVTWWKRKDEPSGIPLLPIWSPTDADSTYEAKQCTARGDFQLYQPGDVPV